MIAPRALALLLPTAPLATEEFQGKVVGIADGDTIRILRDGRAVVVRLQSIEPEQGQAFGEGAWQFTSAAAFGHVVRCPHPRPR